MVSVVCHLVAFNITTIGILFIAEQISTKMPPKLFLQWNNVPKLDNISSPSSPHKLHSRTQNGKVVHDSPATVVTSIKRSKTSYAWPYILKDSGQRTAKCVARMRLQQEAQDLDFLSPKRLRGGKEAKVKVKTHKRRSPQVERRKQSRTDDDLRWFKSMSNYTAEGRHRSLPPSTSKVALKELSIPIRKIPVHVKKKKMDDSDASSSCSSIDCSEQRSGSVLLPSPLNDFHSMAYVIH